MNDDDIEAQMRKLSLGEVVVIDGSDRVVTKEFTSDRTIGLDNREWDASDLASDHFEVAFPSLSAGEQGGEPQ